MSKQEDPPPPPTVPAPQMPMQMSGLPPACRNLWVSGFNARTNSFLGQPIFQPTYNSYNVVQLRDAMGNDLFYQVPDHVVYDPSTASTAHSTASTLKYESDFENAYGFDVSAEGGDEFISVSGDTSFSFQGSLFTDSSKSYELAFFICRTGGFRVPAAPAPFDPGFQSAVNGLVGKAATDPAWSQFFDSFGTHFVRECHLGGFSVLQVTVDNSAFETTSASEFHASFSLEFNDLVSSGSMSASAFQNTSQLYKNNSELMRTFGTTKGGTPTEDTKDFFVSCIYQPIVLTMDVPGTCQRPKLQSISSLFAIANPSIAPIARQALDIYLGQQSGSLFTRAQPVIVNTFQAAAVDGLLVLTASTRGDVIQIETGESGAGTILASATCSGDTQTIWAPIRKQEMFRAITNFPPSDPRAATAKLLPIRNPQAPDAAMFGSRELLNLEWVTGTGPQASQQAATWTAPTDGFMIVEAGWADAVGAQWPEIIVTAGSYSSYNGVHLGTFTYALDAEPGDQTLCFVIPMYGGQGAPEVTITEYNIKGLDGYVACSFVPLLNAHFDHVMLETSTNFALQVPLDALVYCNAYNSNQATSKQAIFTLTQGPTAAAVTEPGATQFIAAQALCELVPQPTITTVSAGTWIYPYVAGCQPQPAAVMLFFMSPGPPQAGQQKADRKRASRRQASRGGKRRARPTRPTRSAK